MKIGVILGGLLVGTVGVVTQPEMQRSGVDLGAIDESVRPQDDFYRYANGRWLDQAEIPPDQVSFSAAAQLQERTFRDLEAIISSLGTETRPEPGSIEQQVGDLSASMMDVGRLEMLGSEPIQGELARIEAIETRRAFAFEAGRLSSIGAGGPFAGTIGSDPSDPPRLFVDLRQSGILLPERDYYLSRDEPYPTIREEYTDYLARIFDLVGRPNPEDDAQAVIEIETALAEAQWTQARSRNAAETSSRFTLRELGEAMPGFSWRSWARPQGINRVQTFVLAQPSFFAAFAELAGSEPLEAWKAWLTARYVTASAPFLSRAFGQARFEFFGRLLSGQEEPIPRWKRSVTLVSGYLGDALGRLYVDRHFPETSRARVEHIADAVIAAYADALREADWMAGTTTGEALKKLSRLGIKVGFPDRWQSYAGLVIARDDLFGNIARAKQFDTRARTELLRANDRHWELTPQTVNAYYSPGDHEIVFPAAILQPPFFNAEADDAVNYGAIGAVIGHEIGHSLDDKGRRFDSDGLMRDWWTATDDAEYRRRARVLVEQFGAYRPLDGLRLDGALTLGENMGDLNGLAMAHRAYRRSLGGRVAAVIDGFTGDQRFFLGWAQAWRAKEREAYVRQYLLSNPHTPPAIRVNGPLSNMDAFVDAFDLKPGDRLYRLPDERVRIW